MCSDSGTPGKSTTVGSGKERQERHTDIIQSTSLAATFILSLGLLVARQSPVVENTADVDSPWCMPTGNGVVQISIGVSRKSWRSIDACTVRSPSC